MAISTDPTDPNFGLETDQSSPNFGLASEQPKQESVVGNALAGAGDVIKGFAKQFVPDLSLKNLASIAYGPVNAQIQGYNALKGVVDTAEQVREAENTAPFSRERFGAGFNVVGQLGLLALGAKAPKPLSEIAGFKPEVAPEVMPQTPEPTISEVAAVEPIIKEPVQQPITEEPIQGTTTESYRTLIPRRPELWERARSEVGKMIPEEKNALAYPEIKPVEEVTQNAVQEQSPSSVLPHPQEGVTETGGERVGVGQGVQGEEIAQARPQTQEVDQLRKDYQDAITSGNMPGAQRIQYAAQDKGISIDQLQTRTEPKTEVPTETTTAAPEIVDRNVVKNPDYIDRGDFQDKVAEKVKSSLDKGKSVTLRTNTNEDVNITSVKGNRLVDQDGVEWGSGHILSDDTGHYKISILDKPSPQTPEGGSGLPQVGRPEEIPPSEPPPVTPETPEAPKTGVSSERFTEQYGEDAPVPNIGRSPKQFKEIGLNRLENFQKTGNVKDDPYTVLTNLREGKVPVKQVPDDVALLRAEHQRLKMDARNAEGTERYQEKSDAALGMANAIKEVAHGPASDTMRSLQEYDPPTYDNVTDFDQALRERENRESTSQERIEFKDMADDVTNTRNGKEEAINGAQKKLGKFPKKSFEDAAREIREQIADIIENCKVQV